ncbi:MAG: exonuclease domain-containing protein [Pseudomonadota bacterium]
MNQDEYRQDEARRRELPTFYYHAHFLEMLSFVNAHYAHVLNASQRAFGRDFANLSFPAQCLYVRLVNRKGSLFARSRLRYPELGQTAPLLDELDAADFLARPGVEQVDEMLGFMTRTKIVNAVRPHFVGMKTTMKKAEMLHFVREHVPSEQLFDWLPSEGVLLQGRADDVRFMLFLFFGRIQDGLSQFTMRDLGLVRARDAREQYEARFPDRDDAVEAFYFARRLADLERDTQQAAQLAADIDAWPHPESTVAAGLRDKLAYRLGRALEGDPYAALRVYQQGESARCSERVIRLLLSTGQTEEARRFLKRCIDEPASDDEALLASDLYARKFGKKRTSTLTDRLRSADTIDLDEAHSGSPERAAAAWFEARGQRAFRVENSLWRTLFGLLFWDLLFDGDAARRHSPFERLPSSLTEKRFATEHADAIAERFRLLEDRKALKRHLLRISVARYGTNNGIFRWRQRILDAMHALVDEAPAESLREVLTLFCEDYQSARYGYPDLMVIDEDGVRFVEIKTDGDHLRRNQLLRLEQLRRAGFRSDVVLVRWVLDPRQPYVVVDVETTGGRGDQHRVTEIGAVKVINGEIVERFQTLLNPQRSIPPNITRLTGITPAMVADAPVFSDVAEDFAQFLDGAIFVAHNVEFDYRFIGHEFRRLGRPFRMPKLCTCASMRKLYPGHKSYSLANLCKAYDIPLKSHHRALCDAEAAAELLLLINEKRMEALTPVDEPVSAQAGR